MVIGPHWARPPGGNQPKRLRKPCSPWKLDIECWMLMIERREKKFQHELARIPSERECDSAGSAHSHSPPNSCAFSFICLVSKEEISETVFASLRLWKFVLKNSLGFASAPAGRRRSMTGGTPVLHALARHSDELFNIGPGAAGQGFVRKPHERSQHELARISTNWHEVPVDANAIRRDRPIRILRRIRAHSLSFV